MVSLFHDSKATPSQASDASSSDSESVHSAMRKPPLRGTKRSRSHSNSLESIQEIWADISPDSSDSNNVSCNKEGTQNYDIVGSNSLSPLPKKYNLFYPDHQSRVHDIIVVDCHAISASERSIAPAVPISPKP